MGTLRNNWQVHYQNNGRRHWQKTDIIANEVSVMEELIKTIEISSIWSFQLPFWKKKKKNEIKNEKNKRKAYFWEELASWIVS